ncbi:MAG TPA: hypothetical protein VK611_15585, partial [Acidimicrobiales bacterium]|nr:hypothetical protein [Acidimicrobiales bacterium]
EPPQSRLKTVTGGTFRDSPLAGLAALLAGDSSLHEQDDASERTHCESPHIAASQRNITEPGEERRGRNGDDWQ